MIYSFDLFDTLVTRRVGTPRGVFLSMQRDLLAAAVELPAALLENFAQERVRAEHDARIEARAQAAADVAHLPEEIDFAEIYRLLGRRHGLDAAWVDRLMEMEIEAEARVLFGVPAMLERFHELARQGARIVLISDMYLRPQDIARLLDGIDPFLLQYAPLYLSSRIKLNKASGLLYAHVAAEERVDVRDIHHVGDNPHSDILRARQSGCQATFFGDCHLTPDELVGADEGDFAWQVAAGVLRECRLTIASPRARLGALHAGGLLLPFVLWAAERARALGRRKLYFLARDGQVLLEIARKLALEDLELCYLHVSRLACHRCVNADFDAFLDWVFVSHREMTLEDVAHRITSHPDELIDSLQQALGRPLDRDAMLSERDKRRLRSQLKSDARLKALVLEHTARERERILGYLDQVGFARGDACCVVDIGWGGSIQDSLYRILLGDPSRTSVSLAGFYWGLQSGATDGAHPDNAKYSFAFHPGAFRWDPTALREIVECFTAADHGSTLGYRMPDGVYVPLLNEEGREIRAWGLGEFRAGIDAFVDRMTPWLSHAEIIGLMPYYFRRLEFLVQNPSELLARELGDFPYSPDPTGRLLPFAPALTPLEALGYHLSSGTKRGNITRWRQGSRINSTRLVRVLMSSRAIRVSSILKGLRPRGFVDLLPYPVISWIKKTLPAPMLRACRSLLRV